MKKYLALAFIFAVVVKAQCGEPGLAGGKHLSIDDVVNLALQANLDVAVAEKQVEIIQSRYRQYLGMALPNVSVTGSYTRNIKKPSIILFGQKFETGENNGFDGAANVDQVVYSGGRVKTGIEAGRKMVSAEKNALQGMKNDIVFTAKRLFYSIMLASATAVIQKDNLALSVEHLDTIHERFKQGLDPDLTVRRQDVEVADAKTTYIQALNLFEVAKLSMQDLLTLDLDVPLELTGYFAEPSETMVPYEAVVKKALEARPELQAAHTRVKIAADIVKLAAGDNKPQLSAFFTYRWTGQSSDFSPQENERDDSVAAGLRLRYSVFTGFDTYEQIKQYSIQQAQAKLAEEKMVRAVKLDVRSQWLDISEALERVRAQGASIEQARLAMEATEKRYQAGQSSQLELNDATFAFNRARTLHAQALHDYWVSVAALERAAGAYLGDIKQ